MKKRFIILTLLIIIFSISGSVWFHEATSSVSKEEQKSVEFVVTRGESIRSIANRLEKSGLIRSSLAFFLIARFSDLAEKVQAGNFMLSPSMDTNSIARALTRGTSDIWITIPEGWRNAEIALELAKTISIPENEFLQYAEEGYMFPDTYLLPHDATASFAAQIFRENFDRRVSPLLKQVNKQQGLSLHDTITIASIVEREARFDKDRPIVAGILMKRWKNEWPLQADATVQYSLGYQADEKRWWKRHLTSEDLKINSPYNTYIIKGIPPGPIANPGLASITAVIHPKDTQYWYYMSDDTGRMYYANTIEEHQQNIEKYLH